MAAICFLGSIYIGNAGDGLPHQKLPNHGWGIRYGRVTSICTWNYLPFSGIANSLSRHW